MIMGTQICGQTIGQLIAVDDMHQRKAEMARLADAFIALPGMYNMYCSTLLAFTVPILNDDLCLKIQVFLHGALEYAGGYGTLEELMEIITWSQLGIHAKPVSFLVHQRCTNNSTAVKCTVVQQRKLCTDGISMHSSTVG